MPTDPTFRDAATRDIRVTITAVERTEIWISQVVRSHPTASRAADSPARALPRPAADDSVWRVIGRELVAEAAGSLGAVLPWLVAAGASALAQRVWRALDAPPRRALPAGPARELPPPPPAFSQRA